MPNVVNRLMVEEYRSRFTSAPCMVVIATDKISGIEAVALRRRLRGRRLEWHLVKNRLARLALAGTGRERLGGFLAGQSGFIFGEDALEAAQAAVAAEREFKGKVTVHGGWLEGAPVDAAALRQLAAIPNRPALQAMVVGALSAPLKNLVNVLAGLMRNLVIVLTKASEKSGPDASG